MRPVVWHTPMVSTAAAPMSRLHVLSKSVERVQGQRERPLEWAPTMRLVRTVRIGGLTCWSPPQVGAARPGLGNCVSRRGLRYTGRFVRCRAVWRRVKTGGV